MLMSFEGDDYQSNQEGDIKDRIKKEMNQLKDDLKKNNMKESNQSKNQDMKDLKNNMIRKIKI
jgi:hypothetical protein